MLKIIDSKDSKDNSSWKKGMKANCRLDPQDPRRNILLSAAPLIPLKKLEIVSAVS